MAASSGFRMSPTSEATMALKAAPRMTATARSTTLPRRMKSRNPLSMWAISLNPRCLARPSYRLRLPKRSAERALLRPWLAVKHHIGEGRQKQKRDHQQYHQVDIQQQNYRSMVETPTPLQAARRIPCRCAGDKQGQNQPQADVHFGEAGEAKTGPKRAESQKSSAGERFSLQTEDGETVEHKSLVYGNAG